MPIKLICPICKISLAVLNNEYKCSKCGQNYPVIDGLTYLLPPIDNKFKAIQKKVYEENINKHNFLKLTIDKKGLLYPTTMKLVKIGNILKSLDLFCNTYILDVGCGDGRLLNKLAAQYGIKGFGIDFSLNQLKDNLENNPFGHSYYLADAERLPFEDNTFDFVSCCDVLEHLNSAQDCIKEICRILKIEGRALIYTISKKDKYTWHWFLKRISRGRIKRDGCFGEHRREHFLSPEATIEYFHETNLKIESFFYFHSFFTLIFDEICEFLSYLFLKPSEYICQLHQKIRKKKDNFNDKAFVAVRLWSLLVKNLLGPLELLDRIWTKKGYSNGFFVVIRKL